MQNYSIFTSGLRLLQILTVEVWVKSSKTIFQSWDSQLACYWSCCYIFWTKHRYNHEQKEMLSSLLCSKVTISFELLNVASTAHRVSVMRSHVDHPWLKTITRLTAKNPVQPPWRKYYILLSECLHAKSIISQISSRILCLLWFEMITFFPQYQNVHRHAYNADWVLTFNQ